MNGHERKVIADEVMRQVKKLIVDPDPNSRSEPQNARQKKAHPERVVTFRGIFRSAIFALFISAIFAYLSTAGIVDMRSALLVLTLAWAFWIVLTLDTWWGRWHEARSNVLSALSIVMMAALLACLHTWARNKVQGIADAKEQDDTYRFLSSRVSLPASLENPFLSWFAVINNGSETIGKYSMSCRANLIVHDNGTKGLSNIDEVIQSYDGPIEGNGDSSETDQCLSGLVFEKGDNPLCLDIDLMIDYSLAKQPEINKHKAFRYLGVADSGKYTWLTEPVEVKGSLCDPYLSHP